MIERRRHPDPAYLLCPPCGLTIKARLPSLAVEHCPRCVARSRVAVHALCTDRQANQPVMEVLEAMKPDVILAITVEAVAVVNYLPTATEAEAS